MASEYSFQFTDKASADLDEAIYYITFTLGNFSAAKNFYDKVEETIKELCLFPKRGPVVLNEYLGINGIRKKAVGNYLIYYLPDEETKMLTILRIVYGKRDSETVLREID